MLEKNFPKEHIDTNNEDLQKNMRSIEPNGVVVIGQDQDNIGGGFDPSQGFDGLLDDIRVFDRIVSEQELELIMNGRDTIHPPVIHLTFDDGKAATDISGFKNHAKIVGDVRFEKIDIPDIQGNKYAIDTNNKDYLIIENLKGFPTDKFSLSFWIKTQDSADAIFSYSTGEYPIDNELLLIDSSKLRFYRGEYRIDPELSINDNQWKHLLITWTSSDGMTEIFINGDKVFSSNKMWCHIPERLGGC